MMWYIYTNGIVLINKKKNEILALQISLLTNNYLRKIVGKSLSSSHPARLSNLNPELYFFFFSLSPQEYGTDMSSYFPIQNSYLGRDLENLFIQSTKLSCIMCLVTF